MSQSATLYRVSQKVFAELQKSGNKQAVDISTLAKNYATFHGSFMGLEFILSKGRERSTVELIEEIFNPKQSIGGEHLKQLTEEELIDFYASGGVITYLDKSTVSNINQLLENISLSDIDEKYDSSELNDNDIYPDVWHDDNSTEQVFNKRQILEDTASLKDIFKQADKDNDYILVYVG